MERLKISSDAKLSSNEESNKEFYLIFFHKKEKDIPLSKFEDGKNCVKFVNNDMYRILYVVSPLILDKVIKALNQKYDGPSYLYKSSNMTLKDIDSSWEKVKRLADYVNYFKKFTEIKV